MLMRLLIPTEVEDIADKLLNEGHEAYIVGGCVRDLLLKRPPKDWDITTSAIPDIIQKIFPDSFYENDYGTVGVKTTSENPRLHIVEVTPYRIESEYSNVRHPDSVIFSTSLSDDLKRRDFTVNAIAYQPQSGTLVDLHRGQEDLERRSIETVGSPEDRFAEDALRMLRAIRLAAELNFSIEPKTALGIAQNAPLLAKISRERVRDEFLKIIMSKAPMQSLFIAQKLGLLKYILPELEEGMGCGQNQAHVYDVFEHLLRTLQHAVDKNWSLEVRLAALLHDVGKPRTREFSEGKSDYSFHGHEVVSAKMARQIMRDLRISGETAEKVTSLVRWHMFFSDPDKITLSAVRRTIRNVGRENIWDLLNLRVCDRIGTGRPKEQPFRLRKYTSMVEEALRDPISVGMLAINGTDIMSLGEKPGPRMGWVLHALLEEILDDPMKNTEEYLKNRVKGLISLEDDSLRSLGEKGKDKLEEAESKLIKNLRTKYHVN